MFSVHHPTPQMSSLSKKPLIFRLVVNYMHICNRESHEVILIVEQNIVFEIHPF